MVTQRKTDLYTASNVISFLIFCHSLRRGKTQLTKTQTPVASATTTPLTFVKSAARYDAIPSHPLHLNQSHLELIDFESQSHMK